MICLTCGRIRPANDRSEYTAERGRLVAEHGLCTCPPSQAVGTRPVESVELPEELLALPE